MYRVGVALGGAGDAAADEKRGAGLIDRTLVWTSGLNAVTTNLAGGETMESLAAMAATMDARCRVWRMSISLTLKHDDDGEYGEQHSHVRED